MTEIHRLARPTVRTIEPYRPGTPVEVVARQRGMDPAFFVKMASNENPLGPAPNAVRAAQEALLRAHIYPECGCEELVKELSGQIGVEPGRIFFGDSSNELINYICRAFLDPGDRVVTSQVTFPMYRIGVAYYDGELITVPNRDFRHDIPAILAAIDSRTKLVWLDSPINPLGTIVTKDELDYYFAHVPGHVLTVVDEAYGGYVADSAYPDSRVYQARFQAIALRTFSKLYGLAGMRVGYLFADPTIIGTLQRVHAPFYLPYHHQAAILAALRHDGDFVQRTVEANRQGKEYLYRELARIGVSYVPTQANFIFYPCADPERVYERFLDFGIIVRPIGKIGVRVTIGLPEQNERFIHALAMIHTEGLI